MLAFLKRTQLAKMRISNVNWYTKSINILYLLWCEYLHFSRNVAFISDKASNDGIIHASKEKSVFSV